eukprot:scaffold13848_cov29-Cyclotella_meneghiniana.AAC.1
MLSGFLTRLGDGLRTQTLCLGNLDLPVKIIYLKVKSIDDHLNYKRQRRAVQPATGRMPVSKHASHAI